MGKYTQLSQDERNTIYALLSENYTKKEIADYLNRHPSTITREIKRNSTKIRYSRKDCHYLPDTAQQQRNQRRKNANKRQPLKNPIIFQFVIQKLHNGWSPDIIAGTLKKKHKDNHYTISHEAIYQFVYSKMGENLKLKYLLTRKHKRRKIKTGRSLQKTPKIQNTINIQQRKNFFPKLENRKDFGHFEGDSILSRRTTYSAIRTEVERKSRYIFCQKISKKSAENTELATINIFSKLPKGAVKSTTWDNGTEHANHEQVTKQTNIQIFFADPYKSWQRGTNEHANGMIRRFFPKGTNFDEVTEEEIQKVVDYINNRPRKILNYRTPKEVFTEYLETFKK